MEQRSRGLSSACLAPQWSPYEPSLPVKKLLPPIASLCLAAVSAAAAPIWPVSEAGRARELEGQWNALANPQPLLEARCVLRFALEAAGAGWHPERVGAALALARSMQDADPGSPTCGAFRRFGEPRFSDPLQAELAVEPAALLRLRCAGGLAPADQRVLDVLLETAEAAVRRDEVTPFDTSLFLLKTWNLIGTGEALSRAATARDGYRQLEEWMRYTVLNGIAEYGSPEGYSTDLDALALIARYSSNPASRDLAAASLRYLWADLAANWWTAGARMAGASSHRPGTLRGRSDLSAHVWAAGWLQSRPRLSDDGWLPGPHANLAVMLEACGWAPADEIPGNIVAHVPRTVVQRWSYTPLEERATHYVGRHVTLAASAASRADDDQALVANLGDSPGISPVTVFMASLPDGPHPRPAMATVQRGPDVLQLLSDDPQGRAPSGETPAFLRTCITLPAQAEFWCGKERIAPAPPGTSIPLAPGQPLFIRVGDAAVGVRILLALGADGMPAPVVLAAGPASTGRVVSIIHAAHAPSGRGAAVVWLRAAEALDSAGFAAFRAGFSRAAVSMSLRGFELRVSAEGLQAHLGIDADIRSGRPIELSGLEASALLSVNGEDVGEDILNDYAAR